MTDELISKTEMLKIIDDERFTVDRKFERLRGLKGQSGEWINLNEAKEHFKYISSLDKEQILHILDRLPTATADNWIPCSERLPETKEAFSDAEGFADKDGQIVPYGIYTCYESEPVLIYGEPEGYGLPEKGLFTAVYTEWIYGNGDKTNSWMDNMGGDIEYKVLAWMELPEPYGGE